MKIMVVDDSMTMRRIVIMNLKKGGYEDIIEAEHGKQAHDMLLAGTRPDVILLDWNMPEMNGMELLQTIKKDDKLKSIPVIMVTTEAEKERVLQAVQAGAMGYLVKPLTPESFQKQVIDKLKSA
jgi:two-component system, chemotaxis family, chemotaxis protein CheY